MASGSKVSKGKGKAGSGKPSAAKQRAGRVRAIINLPTAAGDTPF